MPYPSHGVLGTAAAPIPSYPHFDHALRLFPCSDNMFQFLSNQTPSNDILPPINIHAPQSSPTPLTKHVQRLPDNMRKNDYDFYRQDKEVSKTVNGKKVTLSFQSRNQLY